VDKTIMDSSRTLFYRDYGSGLPVVLLHGFAEDGTIWDQQAASLAAHCRLIIPDLPGSGNSPALPNGPLPPNTNTPPAPYEGAATMPDEDPGTIPDGISLEDLAGSVAVLLDREGIEKCVLIGHSMGGYITLTFAEKYPERVMALGLFHSTAYCDSEEKKAGRQKNISFIRKNGAATFIRQSTPNLFGDYTRDHHPELISDTVDRYSGFSPDSLVSYTEAMIRRPDRTAILRQFAGPVLFVIGREDTVIPMEHSLQQCHLPALSHIHIVEHAGHEAMLENPGRSNEILDSFINFVLHA
jgi:pimeloyl-ACP methyl ester carboxylesterase